MMDDKRVASLSKLDFGTERVRELSMRWASRSFAWIDARFVSIIAVDTCNTSSLATQAAM